MQNKVALIILDGRGVTLDEQISAPAQAQTPFLDALKGSVPYTELMASEEAVGLPVGQVGNSEVGHMTIGAGRVLYQDIMLINKTIEEKNLGNNNVLEHIISITREKGGRIHFLTLLSDAGVHADLHHCFALADIIDETGITRYIHGFTDGRDCDPNSGVNYIQETQDFCNSKQHGALVSLIGRYYGMDRNRRMEKTKLAYDLIVHGKATVTNDFILSVEQSYCSGVTDEYLLPYIHENYKNIGTLVDNDTVIFVNFRNDRPKQLTEALTQQIFPEYDMFPLQLTMVCMTEYDPSYNNVHVLFGKEFPKKTIGEVIADASKTQLRVAETEKYAHVTFFLSGGREAEFAGEERILVPSPKVYTYDLAPGMSSIKITDETISTLEHNHYDFICINYAAPDVVGHTGNFEAVVETCEIVDTCLSRLVPFLTEQGYTSILIADHGNADVMKNSDGSPNTAHSLALVPCRLVNGPDAVKLEDGGSLVDIAPTILSLMDIEIPKEMTGKNLVCTNVDEITPSTISYDS